MAPTAIFRSCNDCFRYEGLSGRIEFAHKIGGLDPKQPLAIRLACIFAGGPRLSGDGTPWYGPKWPVRTADTSALMDALKIERR